MAELRGVLVDWGGVLTQPIGDTVRSWIAADQIDWDSYLAVVGPWLTDAYEESSAAVAAPASLVADAIVADAIAADAIAADAIVADAIASKAIGYVTQAGGYVNPVHALERGECTVAEFERLLAARLVRTDGGTVVADGLLTRMLAASTPVPAMYQLIRDLRGRGVRTALLSNSWGTTGYPREDFPHLFDAVVISAEVGMRKPEPRIFLHAAELLGIPPRQCVFVDDLEANVKAAATIGMTGVHHTGPSLTEQRLTELFAGR